MVLDDHESVRRYEMACVEILEYLEMLVGVFVRRIEKNEIGHQVAGSQLVERLNGVRPDHLGAPANAQGFEIFAGEASRRRMRFDENGQTRAAADSLAAHCAGARVQIYEERILDRRTKDIEKRLAQTVTRGPEAKLAGALELTAAVCSGNHSHDSSHRRQMIPFLPRRAQFFKAGHQFGRTRGILRDGEGFAA